MSNFFEKIFSVRNLKYHKIICIMGIKMKFINYKEYFKHITQSIDVLGNEQKKIFKINENLERIEQNQNKILKIINSTNNKSISNSSMEIASFETAKYVIDKMPTAKAVNSSFDLLETAFDFVDSKLGLILEFGVFSGRTINHISSKFKDKKVFGFDSFEGLPEDWRSGYEKGTFAVSKLPEVNSNVELIKGWFEITLKDFTDNYNEKCAFIHIDCDLYSSAKTIFEYLENRIKKGTVIVFDEYFNYPGWQNGEFKAFQEFIAKNKIEYEYIAYNQNHEQCAIIIK